LLNKCFRDFGIVIHCTILPEDLFLNVIRFATLLYKFSEESQRCVLKFDCIVEPILHLNVIIVLCTLLEVQCNWIFMKIWMNMFYIN